MKTYEFLLFNEKGRQKGGTYEIYLCLRLGSHTRYYSTGILCYENAWDQTAQRISKDDCVENIRLSEIRGRVESIICALNHNNPYWHYVHFEDKYLTTIRVANVNDFFRYLIAKAMEQNDVSLSKQFKETLLMLHRFECNFERRTFCYITREFLVAWNEWMRDGVPDDQRMEHLKTLGLCMYYAEKERKLPRSKNPFRSSDRSHDLCPQDFI